MPGLLVSGTARHRHRDRRRDPMSVEARFGPTRDAPSFRRKARPGSREAPARRSGSRLPAGMTLNAFPSWKSGVAALLRQRRIGTHRIRDASVVRSRRIGGGDSTLRRVGAFGRNDAKGELPMTPVVIGSPADPATSRDVIRRRAPHASERSRWPRPRVDRDADGRSVRMRLRRMRRGYSAMTLRNDEIAENDALSARSIVRRRLFRIIALRDALKISNP